MTSSPATPHASTPWSKFEVRLLVAVTIVGALLRLVHWLGMQGYPWFDYLGLDAKYYDEWAQRILKEGLQGKDPYFMGPLYPHFLAIVYKLFGRDLNAVRGIQWAVSVGTIPLLHLLARRLGGPTLALISSAACAVYGPMIYAFPSILFDAAFPVAFSVLLLLALYEAARTRSLPWAVLAGVTLGIWALGRANILLFAPPAFLWLAAAWGRPVEPRFPWPRDGLRAALLLAAVTVGCILPAAIHNLRAGDFALITTNGGLNLYIGNGPMASGGHETPVLEVRNPDGSTERIVADLHKDVECRTEAERVLGHPLRYTEVSKFWADRTFQELREHPGAFVSRMVRKTYLFWSHYEIPQIEHFGYFRRYSPILRFPTLTFGVIAPLGLVGIALAFGAWRRWVLPLAFVVTFAMSVILFFVLDRYRLPIVTVMFIFAGIAALEIEAAARRGAMGRALALVAAATVLGLFLHANVYRIDEAKGVAQIVYRLGIVEDSRQNWEAAIEHYREALAIKPEYDRAHLNLAGDLARLGRRDEAMEHFTAAEKLNPSYYRIPFNRGVLLEESGSFDAAEAAFRRTTELEPRYLLGRVALAEALASRSAFDSASVEIDFILAYSGRWDSEQNPAARTRAVRLQHLLREYQELARSGIGSCFLADETFRRAEIDRVRGRRDEALAGLRRYFEGNGRCAEAYRSLGYILTEMNDVANARDAFDRAMAANSRLPGVHREMARLAAIEGDATSALAELDRERAVSPRDPINALETGLVHERLRNDSAAAATWFQKYLDLGGDSTYLESRRRGWKSESSKGSNSP